MRPVLPLVPLVCLLAYNINLSAAPADAPPKAQPAAPGAPAQLPLLRGRPDAAAVDPAHAPAGEGVALGAPFESRTLGITVRPPAGWKAVRKVGGTEVEFVDEQSHCTLKLTRMPLTEPMGLEPSTDPKKNLPRAGLLEVTLDRLKNTMPNAAVLRSDVINVGAADVGMIALRHVQGLETVLSQQALFRASDRMYYVISLNSPGSKTAGKEPGDDPVERQAVETFQGVLDTVKLLDQRPLREEQDHRLYATLALFVNLGGESKLPNTLIPRQWFRLARNGKDIGYVYTVEELADGIPGNRRNVAVARGRNRGAAGGASGVLIGMRSRMMPGANVRVESESWMYCSFDRRTEQWSTLTLVQDLKNKTEDNVMTLGSSSKQARRLLDRDANARREGFDKNDPKQPPVFETEDYELNVTHVSKTETAEPLAQEVPRYYLPQALGHLLPRLLPLNQPKQYMFATYVEEARAVMHRYVDVGEERRVTLDGESLRAIPISDRIGLDGSVTTHYVARNGQYLGSENADTGILMLPSTEEKLLEIWKDANLTRPADVKEQPVPAAVPRSAPAPKSAPAANPANTH